ncbi:MAG: universal stress protein [Ardenticatenales bacterium]|nr:universal stress protein [Ardenticatenales bacterium]
MSILVATGGAAHSIVALTFGAHLAAVCQGTVVVLTVIMRDEERSKAETILESARFVLDSLHTPYKTLIRVGHPAEEIIAETEANPYQMVVVGEKQYHSLFTRFVLGATALRVVEHASCPVVVVKGQIGEVRRVLLCDSGHQAPALIERVGQQLPHLLDGVEDITVLHVMSQITAGFGVDTDLVHADAEALIREHEAEGEMLQRDVQGLSRQGHPSTPKVRHGLVVDEILAEANEGNYDLIIIGAHQGSGWRRILLDDIAHQIVVGLNRPVLVMR